MAGEQVGLVRFRPPWPWVTCDAKDVPAPQNQAMDTTEKDDTVKGGAQWRLQKTWGERAKIMFLRQMDRFREK